MDAATSVGWPDGTPVEVTPIVPRQERPSWLSLAPLDVGRFRELADDDLHEEMLDDSRH